MNRQLVMTSNMDEVARLAEFIELVAEECVLSAAQSFNINLALEEAVANVINYGYPDGKKGTITLTAESHATDILFTLTDDAIPFDPLQNAPEVDTDLSAEDRTIGGLGIFLIRNVMADVRYEYKDGHNILSMLYHPSSLSLSI